MAYKWEIYKDSVGEFRVRFKYNAEVMFASEGYTSKQSAINAIMSGKTNMPDAEVEDNTGRKSKTMSEPKKSPIGKERMESLVALERALTPIITRTARAKIVAQPFKQAGTDGPLYIDLMLEGALVCTIEVSPDRVVTHYGDRSANNPIAERVS